MKKFSRYFELIFDTIYLACAVIIGIVILSRAETVSQYLAGSAALVLGFGDMFHLVPRMASIIKKDAKPFQKALGIGKFVTSITMTFFYLLLWHIGATLFFTKYTIMLDIAIYMLVVIRILLCISPKNLWTQNNSPTSWGIARNIPFLLEGLMVAVLFYNNRVEITGLHWLWLAVILSFTFYIPVVLFGNKYPAVGALMLPKTCMYLWILWMFLFI